MVTLSARAALAVLVTALVLQLHPAHAALPDYKLGDVAEADVITPVALVVVNPEATEELKRRVSLEIKFVVRHAPELVAEAESQLREILNGARRAFRTNVQQTDFEATSFSRLIQAASGSAPKDFPFELFAPVWVRAQSDDAVVNTLLQPIREVMAQPIVNNKTDTPLPTSEPVRLVTVKSLTAAPTPAELETPGQTVSSGKVLSLWRARRLVEGYFPPGQESAGRFASSLVRVNAVPDPETTEVLRAKRMDGVAVNDTYDPAQVIVRKGQMIDRKALSAIAVMREKSMIGALQSKLEQEQSKFVQEQAVASQIKAQTKWIATGLAVVCLALVLVLLRLRPRPSSVLVPIPTNVGLPGGPHALPSGEGDDSWRSRALVAEGKAERAQQAIRSGVMGWMREKIVRTLFHQRKELLDAQQKAEAEMLELEQRLEQLHAPLQERITAYEERIEELEKDLAAKGEANRELIGARISVARQHLNTERERGRFGIN